MKVKHFIAIASGSLLLGVLAGCFEGPTGPTGPAGKDGKDGIDANANCTECHANNQVIVAKQQEWETCAHNDGTSFADAGSNSSCAKCHNGAAFQAFAHGDSITQDMLDNNTNINCRACHKIHTKYDTTDWALTTTEPVKMIIDSSITVDIGKGNLCVNCHQPRSNPMSGVTADSVSITSKYWGVHNGPQASVLMGVGGYEVSGSVTKGSSPHKAVVKDGCVECHLKTKNHTFAAVQSACNASACHGSGNKDFDIDGVQTDVAKLLEEAKDTLVKRGIMTVDSATGSPSGVVGKYPKALAGLYQNYLMIYKDGSLGVHNAKYTKYLLTNALEAVKK